MNKLVSLICFQIIIVSSNCLSAPLNIYVGMKAGWNHNVEDYEEPFGNLSGNGTHGGISVGLDLQPFLAVYITPQIKSSSYICEYWPGTSRYYTNLFIPAIVVCKPFPALVHSPYLGLGLAKNYQLSGREVDMEWGTEQPIENLRRDLYFTTCLGIENKLARLRMIPEFSFNYSLSDYPWPTDIDISISVYDFQLTIGLYYTL